MQLFQMLFTSILLCILTDSGIGPDRRDRKSVHTVSGKSQVRFLVRPFFYLPVTDVVPREFDRTSCLWFGQIWERTKDLFVFLSVRKSV